MRRYNGMEFSCLETCRQSIHCGNKFCSAHPQHGEVADKAKGKPRRFKRKSYWMN